MSRHAVKSLNLKWWQTVTAAFYLWLSAQAFGVDVDSLDLSRPVVDPANLIEAGDEQRLNSILSKINRETGIQIGIVCLPSLEGYPIEDVSIRIADRWKLGTAKDDRGILITVAAKDRQLRIEVGQGLEGDIPDAYAKRIIDYTITPYFKDQQFAAGLMGGVTEILKRAAPNYLEELSQTEGMPQQQDQAPGLRLGWSKLIYLILFLFLLLTPFGRAILMGMLLSSGGRGRGHYGSGGGFGGFGGGGGGFSGGGASGRW